MSRRGVAVVSPVRSAEGSLAAAAALACAGSAADRAGLLLELGGRRAPRPTLLASSAARELEERLAAHLPEVAAASRGHICHLVLPADGEGIERLRAVLPLVRESAAAIHSPAHLFAAVLDRLGGESAAPGVMLCGRLDRDRPLIALAVGDLRRRGHRISVLKQPLAWAASRRALLGVLSPGARGALPARVVGRCL